MFRSSVVVSRYRNPDPSQKERFLMPIKKMRIRIANDGSAQIRVEGGAGPDCLDFTRAMEQVLGVVEHRELTPEYDAEPEQVVIQESERTDL
jgi:hypothetical protein